MKLTIILLILLVAGCASGGIIPGSPVKIDYYPSYGCVGCGPTEGPYDWGDYSTDTKR